jgi:ubiquitin conjugation factor E4 B
MSSQQNPFAQLGVKPISEVGPKINIKKLPPQSKDLTGSARDSSGLNIAGKPRAEGNSESLADWEDKILGQVFRLTLKVEPQPNRHDHRLHYVPGVRQDLEVQKEPIRLSTGVLDQAILEAASNLQGTTPLDYLLGCWKRVNRHLRGLKTGAGQDNKLEVLREAKRLCMSYCIFAITMPDMFGFVGHFRGMNEC